MSIETISAARIDILSWMELFIIRRKFGQIISIEPRNNTTTPSKIYTEK